MQRIKLIILLIVTLVYATATEIDDDDITVVEDISSNVVSDFNKEEATKSFRKSRIFWPYPYNSEKSSEETNKIPNQDESISPNNSESGEKVDKIERSPRFFHWSYPHSHIVDMMMQTMAVNYIPMHTNDPFDFLRDSYSLPKGNVNIFVACTLSGSYF